MNVRNARRVAMSRGSGKGRAGAHSRASQRRARRARAAAALVVGLVLFPLAQPIRLPAQEGTPAALRLVEQRIVDIDEGGPLALSPDGRRLAAERRDTREICTYLTSTLEQDGCAPLPARSIQHETAVWSPDGTRLAFTENAAKYLDESDLWVFDAEAGTASNLTDDGVAGGLLLRGWDDATIDTAPAWSPDGAELVFARTTEEADDVHSTVLYRIAAAGGEPTELIRVADERLVVFAGVAWSADGETILYSVAHLAADPANGIWSVGVDGGEPRQLVAAADLGVDLTVLVGIAGDRALLVSPDAGGVTFHLLDLTTGEATEIEPAAQEQRPPTAAALSPDGSRLLLSYFDHLAVRDLATGDERPLGPLDWQIFADGLDGGLTWAANDLVFGTGPGTSGMLLRLAGA